MNQIRHHSLLNTIHRTSGKMLPYKQMAVSIRFLTGSGSNKATPKTASDEEDPGASALQALLEFQRKIEDEKKQKVQWYKSTIQTRMHSSRMRTSRSSPYGGGSP